MKGLILTGDTHLHNSPYENTLWRCQQMMYDITKISEKYDKSPIFLNGDVFHDHDPPLEVLLAFLEWLRYTRDRDIDVYINTGNHDLQDLENPTRCILQMFEPLATLVASDKPQRIVFEDVHARLEVWMLPWQRGPKFVTTLSDCVMEWAGEATHYILLAHQPITEGVVRDDGTRVNQDLSVKQLHPGSFDWVFLSDYHEHQQLLKNTYYLGAPLDRKYGDKGQLGVGYVDFKTLGFQMLALPSSYPHFKEWEVEEGHMHLPQYHPRDYNRIHCAPHLREEVRLLYPDADVVKSQEFEDALTQAELRLEGVDAEDLVAVAKTVVKSKPGTAAYRKQLFRVCRHYLKKVRAHGKAS